MWYLLTADEVKMIHTSDESKLEIGFTLGRNKTVFVVGSYDTLHTSATERLNYWDIVSRFGQELGLELCTNYDIRLAKIVLCEVDPGKILFEIETDATATIRRKAIEAVQSRFEVAAESEAPVVARHSNDSTKPTTNERRKLMLPRGSYPMAGPEDPQ